MLLALLVIVAGLGYLFFGKLEKNLVYFVTPSELSARGKSAFGEPFRLGGAVQKGSIQWDREAMTLQFLLSDGTHAIKVVSNQTPPQMFQEEMGVVVEGHLLHEDFFKADRLMVKHSNEYHPPKEGEKPAFIYKDLIQGS
ncbi:MAG: cytochrome c maturation protein CcmE [bacterium]|nr:cytochrome c maturation protein CcmE [bacterium]